MHIRVDHHTSYEYDRPIHSLIQLLRLSPRNHDTQTVRRWQINLNVDGALKTGEDSFGNVTHMLSLAGPLSSLTVAIEGEVETSDSHGLVTGTPERFPSRFYLRNTRLTEADAEIMTFARDTAADGETIDRLHRLLSALYANLSFDAAATHVGTTAAQAFAAGRGVCQDFAHVFIAAARCLGIPARYVGGHLYRSDGARVQEAGHAWAEAYVDNLGWIGFDAANGVCVTDAYVRVSAALDYLGAAPVRGAWSGIANEELTVAVTVDQARNQYQS